MGKYFGTDGFRGEANVDLTVMHAFEIGRYLGWYYGKDKKQGSSSARIRAARAICSNLPCVQDSQPRVPMRIFCMSQQRPAFHMLPEPTISTAAL